MADAPTLAQAWREGLKAGRKWHDDLNEFWWGHPAGAPGEPAAPPNPYDAATPSPPVAAAQATPELAPNLGAAPQNGWDAWTHAAQPQPQPAQPLTDEQCVELYAEWDFGLMDDEAYAVIRAVELAHGITAPSTPTPPEVAP